MCGIVGVVERNGQVDGAALESMRDTMRHRGPDDSGLWIDASERVGLAHRRLSIIDLSAAGRQPLLTADGAYAITFNGEIYNYRGVREDLRARGAEFRTQTDTEVILEGYRAWGDGVLERLNGMFALALYDRRAQLVLLARDRAGEKPLYFRATEDRLVFASELKALMKDPLGQRVMSRGALEAYLAYGYVPRDLCVLEGYTKLLPAHAASYDLRSGQCTVRRYWSPSVATEMEGRDLPQLVEQLDTQLLESVKQRMLASDVPVGLMLSGGIDSSLVVAAAARSVPGPVSTYTVTFPGGGTFDESAHARTVARAFGTNHVELPADETGSVDLLPDLVRQFDEPLGDSSMVPTFLVSRAIRSHSKVALGGDGGDELFGGYPWHARLMHHRRLRAAIPRVVRLAGVRVLEAVPGSVRGRNLARGVLSSHGRAVALSNVLFGETERRALTRPLGPWNGVPTERRKERELPPAGSPLYQALLADFQWYMPDDILVKVDRASMLTSLEVRAPWLDREIVDFAFATVPDRFKTDGRKRKILPVALAEQVLPRELDLSRKGGFSVPLHKWLSGPWGRPITEAVRAASSQMLDAGVVRRLMARTSKAEHRSAALFALAMLELWRQEYAVEPPPPG